MIRSQRPDVSDQNSGASVSNRPSCLAGSKFFDMVAGKLCEIGWGITRDFLNVGSHGGPTVLFATAAVRLEAFRRVQRTPVRRRN